MYSATEATIRRRPLRQRRPGDIDAVIVTAQGRRGFSSTAATTTGDGRIDEDFGAVGDQMFSCVMRDGRRRRWPPTRPTGRSGSSAGSSRGPYSRPGFDDFNVIEYTFLNRSGH